MPHLDPPVLPDRRRWAVLAVVCLATYAILIDTSIVNVALPTLVRDLGATTTELKWIVDAYNLAFAALVLAGGSLGDRYGRRGALVLGLAVFGVGNLVAAAVDTPGGVIAARFAMGVGAALVFPTTLSVISNTFSERKERAKAIGAWGAMTGLGVASGPIVGGWVLESAYWGSVFLIMVPVAAVALLLTLAVVPTSRDPEAPRLDVVGVALSTGGLGALVTAIIQAPDWGWTSSGVLGLFAVAAALLVGLVLWERRVRHPMLDVRLFRNLRFSAASGSITVAFFGLFGFIFLITQYFQFVRGYTALQSGVRVLPVAVSIGVASVLGTRFAVRFGNKAVVTTGLALLGTAFVWIGQASATTPYLEIVGQMVVMGVGLGLTAAPATEAIMGVVPKEKAGQGSAVNDATREVGGTLGVAVIGSVFASLYTSALADGPAWRLLPEPLRELGRDGIGLALGVASQVGAEQGPAAAAPLVAEARAAFMDGLAAGCLVAAAVVLVGAVAAAALLPSRPGADADPDVDEDLEQPILADVLPAATTGG